MPVSTWSRREGRRDPPKLAAFRAMAGRLRPDQDAEFSSFPASDAGRGVFRIGRAASAVADCRTMTSTVWPTRLFRTGRLATGRNSPCRKRQFRQPPQIKSRIGAILRATSGNFLEQFDFFLFGFYAAAIAKAFFPSENETAALLNTFGVFWLGALMRPVGAIVLGAYIDRIGRRQGLIVTLGDHGDRHRGDRLLPELCDHRRCRARDRADRPAAAGFFRRRRARRRLGLSLGDFDPRQPGLLHLVPVGQPAGRDLRRRDPRLCR